MTNFCVVQTSFGKWIEAEAKLCVKFDRDRKIGFKEGSEEQDSLITYLPQRLINLCFWNNG